MISLGGILGPVVTPFDGAGELDESGFVRNVRAHLAAGLSGIVVTGSTGEAALLEESERMRLVELARAELSGEQPLIVGVGAESTRAVAARSRQVAERGADAVLVVAPHYYGDAMTYDALRDHYLRVADASPVPVLLYTIPKYMHFALPPALVSELARHENIAGMKDSSGDATLFTQYLAARSGDTEALTSAQARLTPLGSRIVGGMGVAGVKAALDAVGLAGGAPRAPLQPLGQVARVLLHELLGAAALSPSR